MCVKVTHARLLFRIIDVKGEGQGGGRMMAIYCLGS